MVHFLHGPLVKYVTLFFAPFLHEDVAIVMAATLIHQFKLPIFLAFGSLYAGVFASDLAIYWLGRAARCAPKLRRFLENDKLQMAQTRLKENRIFAIACCRLLPAPGLLFSTFAACGWFGIPFMQFFLPALISSVIYTAVLLLLVLKFGTIIVKLVGNWGWYLLLSGAVLFALSSYLRTLFDRLTARRKAAAPLEAHVPESNLAGMPPMNGVTRKVGASERIPTLLFYTPLGLRWIWLGIRYGSITLPALADPCIEAGGLWGESKSKCLRQISGEQARWIAPFVGVERGHDADTLEHDQHQAMTAMAAAGLGFPIVAKPDVGWQGFGVRLLANSEELRNYLAVYPGGATIILQQHIPFDGEAGVFYVRMPGDDHGQVASLTFRYFPHVVGDGTATVRELIARDPRTCFKSKFYTGEDRMHQGVNTLNMDHLPTKGEIVRLSFIGSIRVGGLYRDARRYITPALSQRIDAIARSMPEFYFGRFDIRFKSVERLQEGEDFAIIEINGAGAEAIHMWDPEMSLGEAYGELLRFQTLSFEIGAKNRARGYKPMSLHEFYAYTAKQNRLISQYPPSV